MGSMVSRVQSFCGRSRIKDASIAIVGLDAGGKTTIFYQLKLNKMVPAIPTIGFNREIMDLVEGFSLLMWDIGMGAKAGPLRIQIVSMCDAFMYVVNSTTMDRFQEAKEELQGYVDIADHPFIILANKQDKEGACTPSEVARHLGLERYQRRKFDVVGCSALTGEGLREALEKLCMLMVDQER